ncbi:MAG: hypothetical protein DI601_00345 [Azospirillum brasilense]|nr:MAG: hypothetical protein DI601_00345 [Azospirillum brasilense]
MTSDDLQIIDGRPDTGEHAYLADAMRAKVAELEAIIGHMKPGRGSTSIRWNGEVGGFTYSMSFSFAEAAKDAPKTEVILETAKARAAKNGITLVSSMELPREPGGLWW